MVRLISFRFEHTNKWEWLSIWNVDKTFPIFVSFHSKLQHEQECAVTYRNHSTWHETFDSISTLWIRLFFKNKNWKKPGEISSIAFQQANGFCNFYPKCIVPESWAFFRYEFKWNYGANDSYKRLFDTYEKRKEIDRYTLSFARRKNFFHHIWTQ